MSCELVLNIDRDGEIRTLYSEILDLLELGAVSIRRASLVEWDDDRRCWSVRLPDGTLLRDGFGKRSDAIAFEIRYWQDRL